MELCSLILLTNCVKFGKSISVLCKSVHFSAVISEFLKSRLAHLFIRPSLYTNVFVNIHSGRYTLQVKNVFFSQFAYDFYYVNIIAISPIIYDICERFCTCVQQKHFHLISDCNMSDNRRVCQCS